LMQMGSLLGPTPYLRCPTDFLLMLVGQVTLQSQDSNKQKRLFVRRELVYNLT
jgi:hypothetical protein